MCLYRAQGTAICTCPFGMELLASDEKTCTVPEAFILYSTQSEVHMVSLDSPDRDSVIPLHRLTNVVDIHYSVSDGRLYWIDISNKVIYPPLMSDLLLSVKSYLFSGTAAVRDRRDIGPYVLLK